MENSITVVARNNSKITIMPLFHIVILALVQGITEFLPISSSGHLVLAHTIFDDGLANDLLIDVAVHVGTLGAALLYFRRDVMQMICALATRRDTGLLLAVIIGSVPVIAAGFVIHMLGPDWTRSLYLMAWCTLIFGIVLWLADRYAPTEKTLERLTIRDAFVIGLAQVLALVPGTSRSGITITAARALGFSRREAARFSLLLAIVAISGAGTLGGLDILQAGDAALGVEALLAAALAFLSGWAAIALMMRWLEKASFTPFVIYRVALGLLLLFLLYSGAFDHSVLGIPASPGP